MLLGLFEVVCRDPGVDSAWQYLVTFANSRSSSVTIVAGGVQLPDGQFVVNLVPQTA
jgi:hypothetical protein